MGFRDSEKFEYLRQPHIIAIIVIIVLVIGGAIFSTVGYFREASRKANLDTFGACQEFINDADLCRFAAANESLAERSYKFTSTITNAAGTEVTTTLFENIDRTGRQTTKDGKLIDGLLLIDADTYVYDHSDKTWAHYRDPTYTETGPIGDLVAYDFTSSESEDVIDFRDNYSRVGEEACGDLWCLKYKVSGASESEEIFLWIDNQDFLVQKYLAKSGETTTETIYTYEPTTIQTPSPIKEVTEQQLNNMLE